jgi:hypothetical protein
MPNLDEYYYLLRSQPPALDADALRASIRAAVWRASSEIPSESLTETLNQTLSETLTEAASSEVLMETASASIEAGTNLTNALMSSGIASVFGSFLAPLLAVVTVTALFVVGFVSWHGWQGSEQEALRTESVQKHAESVPFPQAAETQGRLEESARAQEISRLHSGNTQFSKDSFDKYAHSFQNDNTEELYPNIPDPAQTVRSEQAPMFDLEMNEQERHLDSLTIRSFRAAPKRDVMHQRQYDLLMQLVQRAREQAASPKTPMRSLIPCSLPAALSGESSGDCILTMLEQQALLLNNNDLVSLTQQARREKNTMTLNALEIYIREHF